MNHPPCRHCDEPSHPKCAGYCTACHGYKRRHDGELPSPEILANRAYHHATPKTPAGRTVIGQRRSRSGRTLRGAGRNQPTTG